MLPLSRSLIEKSASAIPRSRLHASSNGRIPCSSARSLSSSALSTQRNGLNSRYSQNSKVGISHHSVARFFTSSALCRSKASPRKSIHKFNGQEERLDTDEDFMKILEQQKKFVAEHRTKEAVLEAGGDESAIKIEEAQANAAKPTESQMREDRRAIIAKMVQKHVPLKDVSKAVDMFNTLIYGFLKNGAIRDAEEVFAQMDANDIPPSKNTFHMFAKAYSQQSPPMIDELQQLMDLMMGTVGMDVYTFNALISSYAAVGRTAHARPMFELMRSHEVIEDITTCNVLLINYGRLTDGSGLEHAEEVLLWMKNIGIRPDDTTYTALIGCCYGNINRALDFYEAAESAAEAGETSKMPNEERLSAMLRIFASVRQLDQGQAFLVDYLAQHPDFHLSHGNYGALFYLYTSCLQIKQAFDDLDSFLNAVSPRVPVATCTHVVSALKLLPESVLPENEDLLEEWNQTLKGYKVRRYLSEGDSAHWKICLIRWRNIFTPNAERSTTN